MTLIEVMWITANATKIPSHPEQHMSIEQGFHF
jgi:hypothetical protein